MKNTKKKNIIDPFNELIDFTESKSFQEVVSELYNLRPDEQTKFVKDVLLDKKELKKRGVFIPINISIERSFFFDERPTHFCVVKCLKDKKSKVTITY